MLKFSQGCCWLEEKPEYIIQREAGRRKGGLLVLQEKVSQGCQRWWWISSLWQSCRAKEWNLNFCCQENYLAFITPSACVYALVHATMWVSVHEQDTKPGTTFLCFPHLVFTASAGFVPSRSLALCQEEKEEPETLTAFSSRSIIIMKSVHKQNIPNLDERLMQ